MNLSPSISTPVVESTPLEQATVLLNNEAAFAAQLLKELTVREIEQYVNTSVSINKLDRISTIMVKVLTDQGLTVIQAEDYIMSVI